MYHGYYYGFDTTYLLLVVPALLIALIAQIQVKGAFSRYARVRCTSGLTGADVTARADLSAYSDAGQIPAWAMDAMQWANARRLIVGRDSSHLAPNGGTTRAEMAAILSAYIGK